MVYVHCFVTPIERARGESNSGIKVCSLCSPSSLIILEESLTWLVLDGLCRSPSSEGVVEDRLSELEVEGDTESASQCSTSDTSGSAISGMSSSHVETSEDVKKGMVVASEAGRYSLWPGTSCSVKLSVDPVATEVRLEVALYLSKSTSLLRQDDLERLDDLEEDPEEEAREEKDERDGRGIEADEAGEDEGVAPVFAM
jgi:hypothetical protein